jgi:hypothetical protein
MIQSSLGWGGLFKIRNEINDLQILERSVEFPYVSKQRTVFSEIHEKKVFFFFKFFGCNNSKIIYSWVLNRRDIKLKNCQKMGLVRFGKWEINQQNY